MDHMLFLLFCWLLTVVQAESCAEADGVKIVSVMEGEFNTNISDLPIPKITRKYQPCSSESSRLKCVLKCSTKNAPDATLSWYNGSCKVAHTENSDLNIEPSVSLEVEYQDKNTYSCVINNPISNQTTHLNITQHCQLCADMSMTQVPVMEGDSVTLHSNFTDIQKEDEILWMYGSEKNLIAEIFKNIVSLYDCNNGTFQKRLLLDSQTGHLTITNTSKEICGYYKLQNDSIPSRCWGFNITVYARLPVPVITRDTSQSSISSRCSLVCSVLNVSHVTLSWYEGISVLSNISVSDLSISLSLPLEVDNQDKNTYSCVVSYSFTNKTQQLDITGLCSGLSNMEKILIGLLGLIVLIIVAVVAICCVRAARNQT
ncbi:hypothetical protein R3I94_017926 [Phoxinus phoxinus]